MDTCAADESMRSEQSFDLGSPNPGGAKLEEMAYLSSRTMPALVLKKMTVGLSWHL
jgi:hypothetical protein